MGEEADDFEELSLMNEKSRMEFYRQKHGNRRSSQSLPSDIDFSIKVVFFFSFELIFSITQIGTQTIHRISSGRESQPLFHRNQVG